MFKEVQETMNMMKREIAQMELLELKSAICEMENTVDWGQQLIRQHRKDLQTLSHRESKMKSTERKRRLRQMSRASVTCGITPSSLTYM